MPLSGNLAQFNKKVTNRITIPFARRLPWFGVVVHEGRRSGHKYETPINCWVDKGVITVALTYGSGVDWLKNLAAAGGGEIMVMNEVIRFGPPRMITTAEGRGRMPAIVRVALLAIDADEFVELPVIENGV